MVNSLIQNLKNKKKGAGNSSLYAICDGAINQDLVKELISLNLEHKTLFTKEFSDVYDDCSPFLVKLDLKEKETLDLIEKSFSQTWITFLLSDKSLRELALALQSFVIVKDEDEKKNLIIRFYDPRNLEEYLQINEKEDLKIFFEDLSASFQSLDMKTKQDLKSYSFEDETLNIKSLALG